MDTPGSIRGRVHTFLAMSLLTTTTLGAGCGANPSATAPPFAKDGTLAIHRADAPMRVFSSGDEVPTSSYRFEGAKGSVRVTMEVAQASGATPNAAPTVPTSLNDVLFRAEGDGRLTITIRRPGPELPHGRVTIRCLSGPEESSADFEPGLWFHLPSAIVTFESPLGEPSNPLAEGKEVVLGRFVARNVPQDIRLTFKAVFTRDPVAPRTKAGVKPPR